MSASGAAPAAPAMRPPPGARAVARPRNAVRSWPLIDRGAYLLCWVTGIGLCIAGCAIVIFMLVKGIAYLHPGMLLEAPSASKDQQGPAGGFLDPIEGTLLLTAVGMALAGPAGIAIGVWLSEYNRPAWLARAVESGTEMIAGAPSVVLAIFGLLIFSNQFLAFLSQTSANGAVFGRSFLTAGIIMSLLALPLVVTATREGLAQVPAQVREASYALGKTKATTIRKVLLPSIRPSIASGLTLGTGRIVGDTAIVVILLGASLRLEGAGGFLSTLRGTGGTLTSYVKENSPAGEGNAPQKAYAAAFVLLLGVLALNALVTFISTRHAKDRG
jgi:phosphate transport system permease protein